jgi:hypothetical protein
MSIDRSDVEAIKARLSDPRDVARRLGLEHKARLQPNGGLYILCPWHGDGDDGIPTCSLTRGPDGTLRVHCFTCQENADVLSLVAVVAGLDPGPGPGFKDVIARAADVADIALPVEAPARAASARPAPPSRPFPPAPEVAALWAACGPVERDAELAAWARSRGLDPAVLDRFGLVRALPTNGALPAWARFRGEAERSSSWAELGYRAILPVVDAAGEMRSVRARAIVPVSGGQPKALPPLGFRAGGLALANPLAVVILQIAAWRASGDPAAREHAGCGWPWWADRRVVVTEGEPDFLTWATREGALSYAVLGTGSGMWSEAIADAIPDGSTVIIRTDQDDTGDRYAERIAESLRGRCTVLESEPAARAERRRTRQAREAEARARRCAEQTALPGVR